MSEGRDHVLQNIVCPACGDACDDTQVEFRNGILHFEREEQV